MEHVLVPIPRTDALHLLSLLRRERFRYSDAGDEALAKVISDTADRLDAATRRPMIIELVPVPEP